MVLASQGVHGAVHEPPERAPVDAHPPTDSVLPSVSDTTRDLLACVETRDFLDSRLVSRGKSAAVPLCSHPAFPLTPAGGEGFDGSSSGEPMSVNPLSVNG